VLESRGRGVWIPAFAGTTDAFPPPSSPTARADGRSGGLPDYGDSALSGLATIECTVTVIHESVEFNEAAKSYEVAFGRLAVVCKGKQLDYRGLDGLV
jgi:hypothetical protein